MDIICAVCINMYCCDRLHASEGQVSLNSSRSRHQRRNGDSIAPCSSASTKKLICPAPDVQTMLKMLDGRLVQYIRLHYFSSQATRQFTQAMQAGERQQVAGYVLDLRNNPGEQVMIRPCVRGKV